MGSLLQDLRYGLRMLAKNPGFTAVAVLTLALGIGANTAIFSVVNAVLLRPLPYSEPDRLVLVDEVDKLGRTMSVAWPNFLDWREQSRVFMKMASYQRTMFSLTGASEPLRLLGRRITAGFFPLLGIRPLLGRDFTTEDDRHGADPVAILSEGLWRRTFAADPEIASKTITMQGVAYRVIGVVPTDREWLRGDDVYVPITPVTNSSGWQDRGNHNSLRPIARLKTGASLEEARAEMETIAGRLEQQYPATNSGISATVTPLHDSIVQDSRPALMVLVAAVGCVLLIACVNVSNMFLARLAGRQKELAVRRALGAGRARIFGQLLTESFLLSLVGAACGIAAAVWGIDLLIALAPAGTPRLHDVRIDGTVLAFTTVVSLVVAILSGLAPCLHSSGGRQLEFLKQAARTSTPGASAGWLRRGLLVAQISLAMVLLVGAGLSLRSLVRVLQVDPGFDPSNLVAARVTLPSASYPKGHHLRAFSREALSRLQKVPGVESAAMALSVPFDAGNWGSVFIVENQPVPARADLPSAEFNVVSEDYFRTMRMTLIEGRTFTGSDHEENQRVAVISQTLAQRFWPNESAVGKRLKQGWPESKAPWREIVGVAADVKQYGLDVPSRMEVFLPYAQEPMSQIALVVRSMPGAAGIPRALRREIQAIDPNLPVYDVRYMNDPLSGSLAERRHSMWLLSVFAALALIIAAAGIYGVTAHLVSQRTAEIGIRMALGAERGDIMALMMRQGIRIVAAGLLFGAAGAIGATRFMSRLLFGVVPTDVPTYIAVASLLGAMALVASYIPARRAARVDPMVALRYE